MRYTFNCLLLSLIISFLYLFTLYTHPIYDGNTYFSLAKREEYRLDETSFKVYLIAPRENNIFLNELTSYHLKLKGEEQLEILDSIFLSDIYFDRFKYYLYEIEFKLPTVTEGIYYDVTLVVFYQDLKIEFSLGDFYFKNQNYYELGPSFIIKEGDIFKISLNFNKSDVYVYLNANSILSYLKNGKLVIETDFLCLGKNYIKILYEYGMSYYSFYNNKCSKNLLDYRAYLREGDILG